MSTINMQASRKLKGATTGGRGCELTERNEDLQATRPEESWGRVDCIGDHQWRRSETRERPPKRSKTSHKMIGNTTRRAAGKEGGGAGVVSENKGQPGE